jgi:tight adherence protein C
VVPVSPAIGWALALGATLGLGLWVVAGVIPRVSRPRLMTRVAPFVLDVSTEARELMARSTTDPLPVVGFLFSPILRLLRTVLTRVVGDAETTRRRLRQAGLDITVAEFRSQQLVWGLTSAGGGVVASVLAVQLRGLPSTIVVMLVGVAGAGGVALRDYFLQRSAQARLTRMSDELPTVLEFLTLSLSSGEGVLDALTRVSRIGRGDLCGELARTVAEVRTGLPLGDSLTSLATELQLASFTRCVEQLTGALDRGTPLTEVFRAQAQDSREETKRALLESAGKKEVAMLFPLVFVILPLTIAFAVFPGLMVLQVGF